MKTLTSALLALAAGLVASMNASAAPERLPPEVAAAHEASVAQRNARIAVAMADRAVTAGQQAATTPSPKSTAPGPLVANSYRAYPPSCAADPLPTQPSGPTSTFQMPLYTRDTGGNAYTPETVTIQIWRLACSSSGNTTPYNVDGLANSILLMRIKRSSHSTDIFPTIPDIRSDQGNAENLVRVALEPNTVISEAPYDSGIYADTTYVLENYPDDSLGYTYFNYDFNLVIDPVIDGVAPVTVAIDGYSPTSSTYPAAFDDVPVSGYMSASWYDHTHSGEGMLIQIIENSSASGTLFAAWYTYDDLGLPFWITASGGFAYGDTTVDATGYYQTGGGFAGNFGSSTTQHTWGTLSFSFPDCNTMVFSFNGATDAVSGGPGGSGTRTWTRIANTNGLSCE